MFVLNVHNGYGNTGKKTKCHEALLPVGEAIILEGERDTLKNSRGIDKVQPVVLQIQIALGFRPREFHESSVYTYRSCVKEEAKATERVGIQWHYLKETLNKP